MQNYLYIFNAGMGRVYKITLREETYKRIMEDDLYCEEIVDSVSGNSANCQWMVTDSPKMIESIV